MIRPKCVCLFACALATAILGSAQNPPQNPASVSQPSTSPSKNTARIGFVSIQQLIASSDEGQNENAIWQQWAERKRAELQAIQKEVDTLKTQLDVQGTILTEEARTDLMDSIEAKETLLQRAQQDTERESDKRRQRITNTIYRKVLPVIARLAKEKGLDSVFFMDPNRDAYGNPVLLITDDVINAYNTAYPVAKAEPPVKK